MDFRLDEGPYIHLLDKLGNPHLSLPPVIHIAGTNGKGSTLAFLKSILQEAGLKVHAYTSPHLIKFNERITLSNIDIDDETLLHYLDLVEITNDGASITFFEYTTALAFKAFADQPVDICLLETGLGGRLDCTNVVPSPLATVITSIGHDHMDWLGSDIETIAGEKAGIMKPKSSCIVAPQLYDVIHVFEHKAKDLNCDVYCVERENDLPPLGLIGEHQEDNASTAIKTISITHPDITQSQINKGLTTAKWPARMEKITESPDIWFDCGHNKEGALTISKHLKQWKSEYPNRPIHLILGLAADKDPNDFMESLWEYCDSVTCIDLMNARNAQSGEALQKRLSRPVKTSDTIKNALQTLPNDNGIRLMTGSLYLSYCSCKCV